MKKKLDEHQVGMGNLSKGQREKSDELLVAVQKAERDGRIQAQKEIIFMYGLVFDEGEQMTAEQVQEKL